MLRFSFQLLFSSLAFVGDLCPLSIYFENSELEDVSQDRQRSSGGLSMHSFRRNDYGSSPPTRGDSFPRGIHGKWETRSSGRSDKDSDSQSEWDSGFYT